MKTLLLSLVLLLSDYANTAAQAYMPLLRENSKWDVVSYQSGLICTRGNVSRMFFEGDTTINQVTYKKLQTYSSVPSDPHPISQSEGCLPHYIVPNQGTVTNRFFREDTVSKKVWVLHRDAAIPNSAFRESILFDFNLAEGDTFTSPYHELTDGQALVVDSIRLHHPPWDASLQVRTFYMSTVNLDAGLLPELRIFEGIGSGTFIFPITRQVGMGFGLYLDCYMHTSAPVAGCSRYLSTLETAIETLKIYPNPATDFIQIAGLDENSTSNVSIRDLRGRLLLQSVIQPAEKMDVSNLHPGIYLLQLESDGKFKTIKIQKY